MTYFKGGIGAYKWILRSQKTARLVHSRKAGGRTSLSNWIETVLPIFEELESAPEESLEKHFRSCFAAANQKAHWFSVTPSLSSGDDLPVWHGFFSENQCYLQAQSGLSRALFLHLLNIAKSKGAEEVIMAVFRDPDKFVKLAKILLCLGFKQVSLPEQEKLCSGPAVLFRRKA